MTEQLKKIEQMVEERKRILTQKLSTLIDGAPTTLVEGLSVHLVTPPHTTPSEIVKDVGKNDEGERDISFERQEDYVQKKAPNNDHIQNIVRKIKGNIFSLDDIRDRLSKEEIARVEEQL